MAAPLLVQMERDIDKEIERDRLAEERLRAKQLAAEGGGEDGEGWDEDGVEEVEDEPPPTIFYGPQAQIITNDLKSLDEMVSVPLVH